MDFDNTELLDHLYTVLTKSSTANSVASTHSHLTWNLLFILMEKYSVTFNKEKSQLQRQQAMEKTCINKEAAAKLTPV